ncbi:hypothetical protein ACPYO6_07420 [Georgenia sp. Z1344]|uniref:hypothetical protein n=1 Tax=Georgenia sp. Z1344 TaxID=3416706 RepID=UPI003CF701B6
MSALRTGLRTRAAALGTLALTVGLVVSTPAGADEPSTGTDPIVIDVGTGFAPEVTVRMFDEVIVPGDAIQRAFRVRNDGPTDATMTIDVVDVNLDGELDQFFDDVTVNEMPLAVLAGTDTSLLETEIARGEIVTVPLELDFPVEATSGNYSEVGRRAANLAVRVTMRGDTGSTVTTCPDAVPTAHRAATTTGAETEERAATDTNAGEAATAAATTTGAETQDRAATDTDAGEAATTAGTTCPDGTVPTPTDTSAPRPTGGVTGGTTQSRMPVAGPRAAGPVALPQTGPDLGTAIALAAGLVGAGALARAAHRRATAAHADTDGTGE